jgi:hypothetical protein
MPEYRKARGPWHAKSISNFLERVRENDMHAAIDGTLLVMFATIGVRLNVLVQHGGRRGWNLAAHARPERDRGYTSTTAAGPQLFNGPFGRMDPFGKAGRPLFKPRLSCRRCRGTHLRRPMIQVVTTLL